MSYPYVSSFGRAMKNTQLQRKSYFPTICPSALSVKDIAYARNVVPDCICDFETERQYNRSDRLSIF